MESSLQAPKGNVTLKLPGKLILAEGRYVTRGKPRQGSLATVHLATDTETGEAVAIKVFQISGDADDVVEESFRREVQALSELKHEHIIRIRDSGRDDVAGVHFLVMDWVDQDLKAKYLAPGVELPAFQDWSSYFDLVGRPILDALAFAHSRGIAHRDVKPSNVLLSQEGQVQLCDFGISKIRNFLAPGVTLAQFASRPFSPPEPDDGSHSYSRDVFGFAALSLALLSARSLETDGDVQSAIEEVNLPQEVRQILRRCLILDAPVDRPSMASVLLAELTQAAPPVATVKPVVLLAITHKLRSIIEYDMALKGVNAERFVVSDLIQAVGEQLPESTDNPGWLIRLYGGKYGYTARVDDSGARLLIIGAREFSASELDKKTRLAFDLGVRFDMSGALPERSSATIESMRERLATEQAEQKHRAIEEKERKLFFTWLDLLSAKSEMEKLRQISLHYERREEHQEFLRLTLRAGQSASSLMDQTVSIDTGRRETFQGLVVRANGNTLLVRPGERNRVSITALPESGRVETDATRTEMALDRQRSAVEAVRYGRSVNPELAGLIANPDSVVVPVPIDVEFIQKNMDEDKQDAVVAALAGPDLLVVEGPPGTGKTTFITELVLQTLLREPSARVLLTSQTHVALDNSLERIMERSQGKVEAIRIGQRDDERIAQSTRKLLMDEKLPNQRKQAMASGAAFLEQRAEAAGVTLKEIRRSMALDRLSSLKLRAEAVTIQIQGIVKLLESHTQRPLDAEVLRLNKDQLTNLATEQEDLEQNISKSQRALAEYVTKEELAEFTQCSAEDLRIWATAFENSSPEATQLKELLHIHADWEAEFGRSIEFKAALIASSQVVAGTCLGIASVPGKNELTYDLCIVDEASIATPTEVLVPMSRSHRSILVGDNKQLSPFQDRELGSNGLLDRFGLSAADQKLTLFQRMTEGLPAELRKTLTTQHRMLPALGELVSDCFYDGKLKSVERERAQHLVNVWPRPVMWFSTSKLPRRNSRSVGTSFYNDTEAEIILKQLARMDFSIQNSKKKGPLVSVALLTGYGEQRIRLEQSIEARKHEWKSFSEIYVNVVDAFQGREADVVLFSVTRSEEPHLGFLKEMERINVALSRGRELLGIVGDHYYCQSVKGSVNPLKTVIEHIRRHPESCQLQELTQ